MVRRHVREGRVHLNRQRILLDRILEAGQPIELAEALLVTFEASQKQHEDHLARLLARDVGKVLGDGCGIPD